MLIFKTFKMKTHFLFFISLSFFFFGCDKSDLIKLNTSLGLSTIIGAEVNLDGDPTLIENYISFLDNYDETNNAGNGQVSFNYQALKLNLHAISPSVRNITINPGNYSVNVDQNNNFNLYIDNTYFGTNLTLSLTSSLDSTSEQVYIPEDFTVSSPINSSVVSRAAGINVQWNVDTNSLNNKGVIIELSYDIGMEKLLDPSVVGENIVKRYLVRDVGTLNFSSADLSDFPNCRWLKINVAKGNYQNFVINGKNMPFVFINKKQLSVELTD